ncbi:M48 family metalloprotease [Catellatospora sp. KI3]|uniref:M48 family metalloprotease n=1 Tax=Catellatospora sp. KI3 TaxID=3041620 RepID=UPI002483228E|nr:M48 family metalloprotease [Catellatospora sp. KI3]MDI1461230.1 M48 family metalloprotease [Catellatospora sp. KI3]
MTFPAGARAPTGTASRFLLLVAAVLASSVSVFSWVYLAVPAKARLFQTVLTTCFGAERQQFDPPVVTVADFTDRLVPAVGRLSRCTQPLYLDQAAWIAVGVGVVFLLATLLYLLHPWWITRSRGLLPLAGPDSADLVADLDRLPAQVGLVRAPRWLLDPRAATAGGQAFGLPWRPAVVLDAGLIMRYGTDPDAVRAVVRHELAHLGNRDVASTYFSIALWRAFVLAGLLPFAALLLHPALFYTPLRWSADRFAGHGAQIAYRVGAVAALTVVVYLTRNAILRTRELHADARSAAGADATALRSVLAGLPRPAGPWRRLTSRLGTHPSPAARLAAIDSPGRLLRTGVWEMAGVGFTAALAALNASLLAASVAPKALLGFALSGLPAGVLAAGALAAAMWRTAVADPDRPPKARDWLGPPVALVAGYAAALPLTLLSATTSGAALDRPGLLVGLVLLLVGGAALAAWTHSVARGGLRAARRGRAQAVVVTASVALGAPLFALWHAFLLGGLIVAVLPGGTPEPGGDIGWFAALSHVTGAQYLPLRYVIENPLFTVALVGLWAVPALLRPHRSAPPADLGGAAAAGTAIGGDGGPAFGVALRVGAVAGLAVVVLGVAAAFTAKALLPAQVRANPPLTADMPPFFALVFLNTYWAVAVVAAGVAACVVAARSRTGRPALGALATTVVAVVASLGLLATYTVTRCIQLSGGSGRCTPPAFSAAELAGYVHTLLVIGLAVAIPAVLAGALIGRRLRRPHPARAARWPVLATMALLSASLLAAAVVVVPHNIGYWNSADSEQNPATAQSCLVGDWTETSDILDLDIADVGTVRFTGSGTRQSFHADGTITIDYAQATPLRATSTGHLLEITVQGGASGSYRADGSTITYGDWTPRGTVVTRLDGTVLASADLPASASPEQYSCAGETMLLYGSDYQVELTRVRN